MTASSTVTPTLHQEQAIHVIGLLLRTSNDEAFQTMLSLYMANQKTNTPLHEWTLSP